MLRSKKRAKLSTGKARQEALRQEANNKSKPFLLLTGAALVLTPCFFLAPEGAIREGDALPSVLVLLLLGTIALWWNYRFFTRRSNDSQPASLNAETPLSNAASKVGRDLFVLMADISLGVYFFFVTLSYLRVVFHHTGDVRLSTNAYWTFIAPVLLYYFLRYFARVFSRRAVVALFALLVAYSFVESAFSLYSQKVIVPQSQAAYRADPDRALKESGLDLPEGSSERLLFEKRLFASTEPTGTYGLANTLGGVLAPFFLIAFLGYPWRRLFQDAFKGESSKRATTLASGLIWLLGMALLVVVLIETKSRASVLAVVIGVVFWLVLNFVETRRQGKGRFGRALGLGAILLCVMALALCAAFMLGIIDREVFTEAGKSLGYRLDYWRATSAMIGVHPLLGVGPGEFQSAYARYILPTASEFIADPHNFLFEISALFGIPALVSFIAFLSIVFIVGARDVYISRTSVSPEESPNSARSERSEFLAEVGSERVFFAITWGGALGLVATLALSLLHSAPLTWRFYPVAILPLAFALVAAFAMIGLTPKHDLETSFIPAKVALVAIATTLVNLCAAGGFGYIPIAIPLFALLAVVANGVKSELAPPTLIKNTGKAPLALFLVSLCVLLVFFTTAFKPRNASFLLASSHTIDAETSAALNSGKGSKIDPYSSSVAQQCYFFAGANYWKSPTSDNKERWNAQRERVKFLSPNSAPIRETCGVYDWNLFLQNKSRTEFADAALEFFSDAVELSPTDVHKREKLANALIFLGRNEEALKEVELALHYDSVNPHEDRKLSENSRKEFLSFMEKTER